MATALAVSGTVLPGMTPWAATECFHELPRQQVSIARVSDGDTVVLSDQRRVRLIGINTPELHARTPQLATHAKNAAEQLEQWLPSGEVAWLYVGEEPHDRHGRQLGHLVRARDNLAVAPKLLRLGLAAQSAVKPNTLCANQFAGVEKLAVQKNLGLWADRHLLTIKANEANRNTAGFKLVTGLVSKVIHKKRYTEIKLDAAFSVRVRKSLAKRLSLDDLTGQAIEVRGWISQSNNTPFVWLQHEANLSQ